MFLNNLLGDGWRDRVDTRVQVINFPIVQAVKFIYDDDLRQLLGSFNGGWELSFDVTLRGCQFVSGDALLVQFLQNLQRHVDCLHGAFVFGVAVDPEWAGRLAGVKSREGAISQP